MGFGLLYDQLLILGRKLPYKSLESVFQTLLSFLNLFAKSFYRGGNCFLWFFLLESLYNNCVLFHSIVLLQLGLFWFNLSSHWVSPWVFLLSSWSYLNYRSFLVGFLWQFLRGFFNVFLCNHYKKLQRKIINRVYIFFLIKSRDLVYKMSEDQSKKQWGKYLFKIAYFG